MDLVQEASIKARIKKTAKLYENALSWKEAIDVIIETIEIAEIVSIARNGTGNDKKQYSMNYMESLLLKAEHPPGLKEAYPHIIDAIVNASNGKLAINRQKEIK